MTDRPTSAELPSSAPRDTAPSRTAQIARDLIRFDTQNWGGGRSSGEADAAAYVSGVLAAMGVESTTYESEPGRASVVARIEGTDPSLPLLVVHGHLDVVPADASEWTVDPFAGEIRDGLLWGRGAVDMKQMDAMILVALERMLAAGKRPRRGLIVAFFADEEAGGIYGSQWLVRNHPEVFAGATEAGGANDEPHVSRDVEAVQGFAKLVAFFTLDPARNAACTRVVRHQNKIAAGQADEGGQGGALVAALFFFDLDDDFLAFAQDVLDVHAAFGSLPEVFAGNFLEGEEAVAVGTEVHEGGFEAGFDAGDLALVDVGFFLFAGTGLDVEIEQALAVYQCDTQLFGLSCVN